ncbi:MAG: glycosyltransferase family 2 protein [Sulfolobales archaeon]|nr:glycosyltransferase family 2 protein [Sulfolobales archaeon]
MGTLETSFTLMVLYTVPFIAYQTIMYWRSLSLEGLLRASLIERPITDPLVTVLIPTKGERIETVVELVRLLESSRYANSFEIVVVSDDDEGYFNELKRELSGFSTNVKVYRREVRRGFKACALQYGFERSNGDYVVALDVDARLNPDEIMEAIRFMEERKCDAATLRWVGYVPHPTMTGLGIAATTSLVSRSLFIGRAGKDFAQFPVGSGTIFRASSLRKVGGWDCSVIQDDLDVGARMISEGMRICATNYNIMVEVPSTLRAFVIQQSRWSYGTAETLRRNLWRILSSKRINSLKKLDAVWYLLQYTPIWILMFAMIVLAVSTWTPAAFDAPLWLFLVWLGSLSIYGYLLSKELRGLFEISPIRTVRVLGRISALSAGISPYIFYGFLRGLAGKGTYKVTPKGSGGRQSYFPVSTLILAGLFLASSVKALITGDYASSLWLFYYGLAYVYTVYVGVTEG